MADARPPDPKTSQLVRAATSGDAESFGALFARVAPALISWAGAKVHPALRARLDAEDIVQEIVCEALKGFRTYDPGRAPFRAWLFGIAHHVLARVLREFGRGGGRAIAQEGEGANALELVPDDLTSLSRRVARDEALLKFRARVDALSEEERRLLVDHGLEGRPLAEVAPLLQCSVEAAKKRWQRLRGKLDEEGMPALLAETLEA